MAELTDAQIEAGAIALYADHNTNGDIAYVEERWPTYSPMMKAPYLRWSRVVVTAALSKKSPQGE